MARGSLFRNEVMEAQRGQWLGALHLATPLSFLWVTLLFAILAAAVVLFMLFGHYTRREQIVGQLVPTAGLLGVHSPTTGTVARVYVHSGEMVHLGDAMVEISGERDSAALGSTQALIGVQLRAQAERLQEQIVGQRQSVRQQVAGLHAKLALLQRQTAQIDGQIELGKQQVVSSRQMLAKLLPLRQKGYVSAYQVAQQRADALQRQSQVKALVRQRLATRLQIGQVRQQLKQLPLTLAAKQNNLKQALSHIDEQRAKNELQRNAVLRAPSDGVVSSLLVSQGQAVAAGQALLSVLPKGSALQAQLLVPSSAIGFVEAGNQVVMRYRAYPYQKFGQQYGRVVNVSRSALSNDEVASLLGTRTKQPLYRVLVMLNRQTIDVYGKTHALKPGMAVNASIMLDCRSLWQWAFQPLYGLKQRLASAHGSQG